MSAPAPLSTACGRFWTTLRVMLYKNWLLKSRRPLSTLFEILIPVMIMLAMVGIHSLIPKQNYPDQIYADNGTNPVSYQSYFDFVHDGKNLFENTPRFKPASKVAFVPNNSLTQAMVEKMMNITGQNSSKFLFFDSDADLNSYIVDSRYGFSDQHPPVYAAMVFYSFAPWDYAIRMNATTLGSGQRVPQTSAPVVRPLDRGVTGPWQLYKNYGFVWFQMFVDSFILNYTGGATWDTCDPPQCNTSVVLPAEGFQVSFLPFPTIAYTSDVFSSVASNIVGLFFTIGYLWPVSRLVRDLTLEKEKKIKEGMKMMGLSDTVFWLSWIIMYVLVYLVATLLILAETTGNVYANSEPGVVFLYFFVFSLSCFSLSVLISTFFDKAKSASTFGAIIFLASFFPFYGVTTGSSPASFTAKKAVCILAPACFGLGAQSLSSLESAGIGANTKNWYTLIDNFSVGACIGMMFLDTVLYFVVALYIEKVFPGAYGTPYPPYFIFLPSYWFPRRVESKKKSPGRDSNRRLSKKEEVQLDDLKTDYVQQDDSQRGPDPGNPDSPRAGSAGSIGGAPTDGAPTDGAPSQETDPKPTEDEEQQALAGDRYFEHVPKEVSDRNSVKILNIKKSFDINGQIVNAVRGVDFDIYEGQITALLGHNGAGKSTLISMLTGLIPPSTGDAEVYGYKLTSEMARIREFLGVCPQHDVLFDDLTVREHLVLFARLKGTPGPLDAMIEEIIADVGLTEKTHSASSTLSGGQKRKLSIAIALIGNSKVVFLDECTSGMDVYSRRWIWNMLLKKKEGRIIILTTHFMDEADQLGDRIAVMSKGLLKCCGSSLFLKNLYGVGYTMTISKGDEADPETIVELVKRHVNKAEQLTSVGGELQFRLPFTVTNKFPDMFHEMDQIMESKEQKEVLIKSYGIAVTTLEEVFLRVGKEEALDQEEKSAVKLAVKRNESRLGSQNDWAAMDKEQFERDGFYVGVRHFVALFIKRWHNARRDKRQWIFQVILPLVITFAGLSAIYWGGGSNSNSLELSGKQYNQPNYYTYNNQSGLSVYPPDIFNKLTPDDGFTPDIVSHRYRAANGEVTSDVNMSWYLLDTIQQYKENRYGAVQISDEFVNPAATQPLPGLQRGTASIYFNNTGTHSLPISVNAWHIAILRWLTGNMTQKITLRSYPFPITSSEIALSGLTGGIIIGTGFAFIPSSWVAFAVKEREINAKHQQLISGVSTLAYWLSTLLWDFFNYLLPLFLALILIAGFNIQALLGENLGATFLSMLLYGPAIASFTYMWSFLFKSHSTAQNVMIIVYVFTGVLLAMASFILDAVPSTQNVNRKIKFLYRFLPNFCFGEAIINLIARGSSVQGSIKGTWDMEVVGWPCLCMTLEAVGYFLVVLVIEKVLATPALLSYFVRGQQVQDPPHTDDEDVAAEKKRLQEDNESNKNDIVKVRGLRKEFNFWSRPTKVAVKDMWFGIHEGECFGFLGINGAGKTTTLQMLTGAEHPTGGNATLKGFNIMTQQEQLRRHMGYCPQFDALVETLTGRETLCLYARIKGVPEAKVANYVNAMIKRIGLKDYADRPCGGYSGGNKRKLSVGVALIGNPSVIFLDEPSTGMDPAAKRFMWDLIAATNAGRSLILTTHSLEEAEALCHRIGIVVSGRLRCLGSAQHLRHRYGQGYQIELKTEDRKETIDALKKWVEETFGGAQLVEIHGDRLKYKINRDKSLGTVFGEIERNKHILFIHEYSCSEYSLEQIFIHFAKQQEEEQAHVAGVVGSGAQ